MQFLDADEVRIIKSTYKKGDRLRLIEIKDGHTDLKEGDLGSVDFVDGAGQIHMIWESHSTLPLILGVDKFVRVKK